MMDGFETMALVYMAFLFCLAIGVWELFWWLVG